MPGTYLAGRMIGSNLHIEETGEGEPVLLLHSSGLSGRQWRGLASALEKRGKRAVVPDLSGHGASEPWPEPNPFSFRTDVDRIVSVLQSLGPTHVIGHSYGGFVALQAAVLVPSSFRSLSLFDPVAFGVLDATADRDALMMLEGGNLSWGPDEADRERWLQGFIDFWGGPGAWAALKEPMAVGFRRIAWVVREGVRSLIEDKTGSAAYSRFSFPVQLVTAENTPLTERRVIQRLSEAIPGSRVAIVPDAGHLAPVTHADAVNRIFLDALPD